MKKNTNVHLGRFFPFSESELGSKLYHKLEISVFRLNHTYSNAFSLMFWMKCRELFSTVSLPISNLNLSGNDKCQTKEIPLSVILPYFQKTSCFLTVRMKTVYSDSVFQLSNPEGHIPILTSFEMIQARLTEGEWKQRYIGAIELPNRDVLFTEPLFGLTPGFFSISPSFPAWKRRFFVAFNPEWLRQKFEVVVYSHNDGLLRFVASGTFTFQFSSELKELCVPVVFSFWF